MTSTERKSRPNVVVFFTDQQRADTTGLHGNPMGLTPNFDRMATEGTHFANTFTCQPVCGPARATLQTGKYASTTGVWRNGILLPPREPRMATAFQEAGYTTGYIGKWHLSETEPVPRDEQAGYDYWMGSNVLEFTSDAYDLNMFDAEGTRHHFPGYRVDAETDVAIRFIDEHQDEPFFLFLSYLEPHHQNHVDAYPAPTGYETGYADAWMPPDLRTLGGSAARHLPGYYGMVRRLDESLGRVEDALRSLSLLDDTIILYISDHGNHFKTRNAEYKRSCHDGSIRVPCFAVGPGFTGGGRVDELFSIVDIPPTLMDASGLEPLRSMHGRSAMPLLRTSRPSHRSRKEQGRSVASGSRSAGGGDGQEPTVEWPDHVFVQISEAESGRAVRTHRWKYGVSYVDPAQPDLRPSAEHADAYTELFLYDLYHDPYELNNLVNRESHSSVRARMRKILLQRIKEIEGRTPEIHEPELLPRGQRSVSEAEVAE